MLEFSISFTTHTNIEVGANALAKIELLDPEGLLRYMKCLFQFLFILQDSTVLYVNPRFVGYSFFKKAMGTMTEFVKVLYGDKEFQLPVVVGTEGEKAIDISKLRQETGLITLDTGYGNTGSCTSNITFMDGETGILRYRGIPVEQLAEQSSFIETAYLLINGRLPSRQELTEFSVLLNDNSLVHEDMRDFFENYPRSSHPIAIRTEPVTGKYINRTTYCCHIF